MTLARPTGRQLPLRMQRPVVLGIGGCSGSGKTTLARELASQLNATIFPLDLYYRDLSHIDHDKRTQLNFDHPDSLESELLIEHVAGLAQGCCIDRPVYDFSAHTRVLGQFERVAPGTVVIVEGIFALHYDELRAHYDLSIYVECPEDLCFTRRLARDVAERGRTPESVKAQYEATAKPMARQYVIPSAKHATLSVDATGSLDWSVEQVFQCLQTHGLLPVLRS